MHLSAINVVHIWRSPWNDSRPLLTATAADLGLSATQRPMDQIARFLVGVGPRAPHAEIVIEIPQRPRITGLLPFDDEEPSLAVRQHRIAAACSSLSIESLAPTDETLPVILDIGHRRQLDLLIEVPPSDLGAVCMHEQWAEVNERIVELVKSHRATLIFVNTRRLAERLTHQLSELLGEEFITSHHGSLAYKHRHDTEQRLKSGELKAVVATASLEMGIDVGYIDLVIQIGSPVTSPLFCNGSGDRVMPWG